MNETTDSREITSPERVRAGCPRCDWNSPWCWVDDMPNALWFAERRAFNAFHDHYRAVHQTTPSPIWEDVQ